MELAIDRHGASHRAFTRRRLVPLLFKQAMNAKATRPRILMLQVQDLFEKRQAELISGVWKGSCPMVLEAFKTISFKGLQDIMDMATGQLQTAGNTAFVPAFIGHAYHCPTRLVGIGKIGKHRQVQLELPR